MVSFSKRCLGRVFRMSKKRLIIFIGVIVMMLIVYHLWTFGDANISYKYDRVVGMSQSNQDAKQIDSNQDANRDANRNIERPRVKTFICFQSKEVIDADQVNDDYCDCADGSDEPLTSACPNNRFKCKSGRVITFPNHKIIPASRVNDGICDCCDGSDEWLIRKSPIGLFIQQLAAQRYTKIKLSPCNNVC